MDIRKSMKIVEGQGSGMAALEAVVQEMDALRDKAADIAREQIGQMIAALAAAHPDHQFRFWQSHGIESVDVEPPAYEGAPKSLGRDDVERGLRAGGDPAMLSAINAILDIGIFVLENFNTELGMVPDED